MVYLRKQMTIRSPDLSFVCSIWQIQIGISTDLFENTFSTLTRILRQNDQCVIIMSD